MRVAGGALVAAAVFLAGVLVGGRATPLHPPAPPVGIPLSSVGRPAVAGGPQTEAPPTGEGAAPGVEEVARAVEYGSIEDYERDEDHAGPGGEEREGEEREGDEHEGGGGGSDGGSGSPGDG